MHAPVTETHHNASAGARIADWLNKTFGLSIGEDDPTLFSKARAFSSQAYSVDDEVASGNGFIRRASPRGQTDPLIESLIREAEREEQQDRETRHEREQKQVEQRMVKAALAQQQHTDDFWQKNATYIYGCIDNWFEKNFGAYFATHYAGNLEVLIDAIGEVQATRSKEVNERTDELVKPLERRVGEIETLQQTREQSDTERNTEFMQRITERLNKHESMETAVLKHMFGDVKQALIDHARTIDQRLDELEATEAKHNAELAQTIEKALVNIGHLCGRIDACETLLGDQKERIAKSESATGQMCGTWRFSSPMLAAKLPTPGTS